MDRQGDGKGGSGSSSRSRAVARLTTLQRLRDDALAKNRQSMLRSIEDMIASELRTLHGAGGEDEPAREKDTSKDG